MASLYKIIETNTDVTKNNETRRVEILLDLKGEIYKINDKDSAKEIVCACGSCEVCLKKDRKQETVTLSDYNKTIHVDKNISVELRNYTKDTRIVVEYWG